MMRAGKDYITKGGPSDEPDDARSKHLRELLQAVGVQSGGMAAGSPVEAEEQVAAKPTNQDKPTLKLQR